MKNPFKRKESYLDRIKKEISDKPCMTGERVLFMPRETDMFIPLPISMN